MTRIDLTKSFCHTCRTFVEQLPQDEKCAKGHSLWDPSLWKVFLWTTTNHHKFPKEFQQKVKIVLMMALLDKSGRPRHPETYFYKLPKDILKVIFEFLAKTLEVQLHSSDIKQYVSDIRSIPPSKELIQYWLERRGSFNPTFS